MTVFRYLNSISLFTHQLCHLLC